MLVDHLQAALQVRDYPVLQLGHAAQVALAAGSFQLLAGLLDLLLDLRRALYFGFLRSPDFFQVGILALQPFDFFGQLLQALLRCLVFFLLQRLRFHFQLDQPAIEAVEHFRLGVDLHADAAGRFVDQVNGLVRQLTVGDVAVAEFGRSDNGTVGDGHLVVHFVAFFQATQDGDGVFFARFLYQHFLEAALQGGVFLDELAVLVQRSGAHAVQFATGQGRLEHVACVHGTLALAGANHGVQFVDEQNDLAFLLGQLVQQPFQALLELTAVLGTRNQRAHVQRQQAFAFQAVGHFAIDDALGQALGDGGLAHAGFADQHRIILGTALQHLDRTADFVVTANDRVQLAFFGTLGQVDGVLVQRLARLFGVGVIHRRATAQVVDGIFQGLFADTLAEQQLAQLAVLVHGGQQHQLAGNELVALLLGQAVGLVEQARQVLRHVHVAGGVLDFRQLVEFFHQCLAQAIDIEAHLHQQWLDRAALLFEQCLQQVHGLDGRVVHAYGQGLGIGYCKLQLAGQTVYSHGVPSFKGQVGAMDSACL